MAEAMDELDSQMEKLTITDSFEQGTPGDFAGHTLFLPAVSVGNVGQLTMDLLLENLPKNTPAVKIGRIFHPSLEAVIGAEPIVFGERGSCGLMTSCEIFHVKEAKHVIMHFHSPVTMKGRQEFVEALIIEKKFIQVVVFSSVFASDRIDPQLVGIPFRYLTTDSTPQIILQKLIDQEWKPIERREFPAPAIIDTSINYSSSSNGVLHLPGSGITKNLFESCAMKKFPFLALIMFASEGDNTPEALTLFQMADRVFSFRNICYSPDNQDKSSNSNSFNDISPSRDNNLNIPISWTQFKDDSHPFLY